MNLGLGGLNVNFPRLFRGARPVPRPDNEKYLKNSTFRDEMMGQD